MEIVVIKNRYLEIKLFHAYQNGVIQNFAVIMSAVIKRVDFLPATAAYMKTYLCPDLL